MSQADGFVHAAVRHSTHCATLARMHIPASLTPRHASHMLRVAFAKNKFGVKNPVCLEGEGTSSYCQNS